MNTFIRHLSNSSEKFLKNSRYPNINKVTTLPNGVRVVSEDTPGYFVGVGAYLHAGPRYEPLELRGLAQFNEKLAFKVF